MDTVRDNDAVRLAKMVISWWNKQADPFDERYEIPAFVLEAQSILDNDYAELLVKAREIHNG